MFPLTYKLPLTFTLLPLGCNANCNEDVYALKLDAVVCKALADKTLLLTLLVTDALNAFEADIDAENEDVTELNSGLSMNPVPSTIPLILVVILLDTDCIFWFILDDNPTLPLKVGAQIDADKFEPELYRLIEVVAADWLYIINSASLNALFDTAVNEDEKFKNLPSIVDKTPGITD
jgi:hypothetical protein